MTHDEAIAEADPDAILDAIEVCVRRLQTNPDSPGLRIIAGEGEEWTVGDGAYRIEGYYEDLLPFLAANLVMAVAQAVLASIGLEALGLGTPSEPTLGMTIFWLMNKSAFLLGLWWWILAPITVLVVLFVGLFLISAGLDELANPRLRGLRT